MMIDHHKSDIGIEQKYTNRLIHEASPYLLRHAHNPVESYTWGPEALEQAKTEQKPILPRVNITLLQENRIKGESVHEQSL